MQMEKTIQTRRVEAAAKYSDTKQITLAQALGIGQSAFSRRLKRGRFFDEEMHVLAGAIGAEYKAYFEFPDGTRI